jgi:hypothetical protein
MTWTAIRRLTAEMSLLTPVPPLTEAECLSLRQAIEKRTVGYDSPVIRQLNADRAAWREGRALCVCPKCSGRRIAGAA